MDQPHAYATGRQRFCGLDLIAAPGALVPRAETELLAQFAIRALAGHPAPRVIDMGCGSGNLACAIAFHLPAATVWASDLTAGATAVARRNVAALDLAARVTVAQGDLFAALAGLGLAGSIDIIVCNPPYISTAKLAERHDLADEPREAFDGGPYGLSIHQRVIRDAVPFLRPGGLLCVEFGVGQARQIELLFQRVRAYEGVTLIANQSGEPRVAAARVRAA